MFDWYTEEEADRWRAEKEVARPGRRWPWFVLGVVLLGLGGWGIGRALEQRTAQVLVEVERDVAASHAFLHDVATQGDGEVFLTLLSGRDAEWAQTQTALLRQNSALHNAPRPFGLEPYSTTTIISTTILPDLSEVVVLAEQTYTQVSTAELVTLQQMLVYRRGETGWLLSSPTDTFWGGGITSRGPFLIVHHSQRDWDISRRLAQDLDRKVRLTCESLLGMSCTTPVTVRFDTNPAGILQIANPTFPVISNEELVLPTPSLIGLPVDEVGYDALLEGYAAYVLAHVLNRSVSWACCQNAGGYHSLLTYQLDQVAGATAPLAGSSSADLIASLDELPPETRPGQDLALLCEAPDPTLYRYSFTTNVWQTEQDFVGQMVEISPLPDDSGYFVARLDRVSWLAESVLVREGVEEVIADSNSPLFFMPVAPEIRDPAGTRLLAWYVNGRGTETGYVALDYADCHLNNCRRQLLPGLPSWSPTGEHQVNQLLDDLFPLAFIPAGATRADLFDHGLRPFWLDEGTFGYFTGSRNQFLTAQLATVDDLEPTVLLTVDDLVSALPAGYSPLYLSFYDIIPLATDPNSAFVLAHDSEGAHIFLLQKSDGQRAWRANAAEGRFHLSRLATLENHTFTEGAEPHLTPDGRFLALPLIARDEMPYKTYLLFDWQAQVRVLLGPTRDVAVFVDWSGDGEWLARPGDGFIDIIAPSLGETPTTYRQILFHEWQNCSTVFWLDR